MFFSPYRDGRDRIIKSVQIDSNGCWIWQRFINQKGYGKMGFRIAGKNKSLIAHRVSYESFKGPIPKGLEIDHLCKVRSCVNPDHLEAVTHKENLARSNGFGVLNALKTHCPQGHEYTPDNLTKNKNRSNYRQCRICNNEQIARRYAKKRAKAMVA